MAYDLAWTLAMFEETGKERDCKAYKTGLTAEKSTRYGKYYVDVFKRGVYLDSVHYTSVVGFRAGYAAAQKMILEEGRL